VTNRNGTGTSARRAAALVAGILAGLAVARLLSRRRAERRAGPGAVPDPRADELRRKLAETGEPSAPAEPEADVDEARRRVHDEAQSAIDEMRRSGET
jgi:hypothetical protein